MGFAKVRGEKSTNCEKPSVNAEGQLDVCGSLTDEALHIAYQNYLAENPE
ncbi:hypothetical protein LC607_06365 [Nostoc sp. CHAB 5824]|nr:hypothetical protein [Nostoc sp. CHAB 5824]